MAYVIGLTGGIATGKSHVSAVLSRLGLPVVDADGISRQATAPGGAALPAIRRRFSSAVFCGDMLDRKKLGALVFSDEQARRDLEAIVHPLVFSAIAQAIRELDEKGSPVVIVDMPLLFETGFDRQVDQVWLTVLPQEEQVARLMARDGLTREQAMLRIGIQMPQTEKITRAHRLIDTTGSRERTAALVRQAADEVLRQVGEGHA